MKKFLTILILSILIVGCLDFVFGKVMDSILCHSFKGEEGKISYVVNRSEDDIIIMGSSRAYRHINPSLLEDSLGQTVFNAGLSNMGIICNYGVFKGIISHHKPKLIIYDISHADFAKSDELSTYTASLKMMRSNNEIRHYVEELDPTERIKMLSGFYCFNTKFITILQNYFESGCDEYKGYKPYKGVMDYTPQQNLDTRTLDELKCKYFDEFIRTIKDKGIQVVVTVSPYYYPESNRWIDYGIELCAANAIPFLDYSKNDKFNYNKELFYDQIHLNEEGSTEYTKELIKDIKELNI